VLISDVWGTNDAVSTTTSFHIRSADFGLSIDNGINRILKIRM